MEKKQRTFPQVPMEVDINILTLKAAINVRYGDDNDNDDVDDDDIKATTI